MESVKRNLQVWAGIVLCAIAVLSLVFKGGARDSTISGLQAEVGKLSSENLPPKVNDLSRRMTATEGTVSAISTQINRHEAEDDRAKTDLRAEVGELRLESADATKRVNEIDKKLNQIDGKLDILIRQTK